jgi:hypothetical protein
MNIQVARKLHERRFRPNPVMTTGELLNLIGSEGMQEAIDKRWLVPDQDTGFMMLNFHGGKLLELESACRCACGKTDCACEKAAEDKPAFTMPMREAFAGFGVSRPGTPTGGPSQPAPMTRHPDPTPTSQSPAPPRSYRTGEPVMIEQDKVTYQGEISGFEPDGRVRVRWSGQRPPEDRAFGPGEFLVTDKPNA